MSFLVRPQVASAGRDGKAAEGVAGAGGVGVAAAPRVYVENKYRPDRLSIYYEDVVRAELHVVRRDSTLKEILRQPTSVSVLCRVGPAESVSQVLTASEMT